MMLETSVKGEIGDCFRVIQIKQVGTLKKQGSEKERNIVDDTQYIVQP